ncbi:hypothetical protein QBC41DRAFT_274419 [Cercophora samala]|uniref:Uncharacterized protein n=1 Tax=Cercophora samala TaxID=330535 RepID=A0AA40DD11_9PEZI|nr:hypothetical protein QBC41DRAFT_274419 [Cercophora samala]
MDVASPYSKNSMTAATDLEAKKQPTYTTVGSIYNPNAANPIQAPPRRPRTRRFPQPLESPSGEAFDFADPLRDLLKQKSPPSPPTTANVLKQYTPLQQNYDRALSPISEQEHRAMTMNPKLRRLEAPSPLSLNTADVGVGRDRSTVNPAGLPSTTSSGPPQPLTAGPPGLRQFKRNTFDLSTSSVRTSRWEKQNEPSAASSPFPIGHQAKPSSIGQPFRTGVNYPALRDGNIRGYDAEMLTQPFQHGVLGNYGSIVHQSHTSPDLRQSSSSTPLQQNGQESKKGPVHDTLPVERIAQYFPNSFPHDYTGQHTLKSESWATQAMSPKLSLLDQEAQKQRQIQLAKSDQQIRDQAYGRMQRSIGAIGAERERRRSAIDKPVSPKLSIEDTTEMGSTDYAKPLLDRTYDALLKYRDSGRSASSSNGWYPKFAEPDESLIDHSPEGNNSFFDDPRTEAPKKKKIAKPPRKLGY